MLSSIRKFICLATVLAMVTMACRKDELPAEHYFGTLSVGLYSLPGTPDNADLKLNDKLVGQVFKGGSNQFSVPAGVPVKLSFFEHGKDSLVFDTTITLAKNSTTDFKLAMSLDMGIVGQFNLPSTPVSPDSAFLVLFNDLDTSIFSESIDLEMYLIDINTLELKPNPLIYKDIRHGQIYPGFMYTVQDQDPNLQWVQKIKNRRTGEYIFQPNMGADWTQIWGYENGTSSLAVLTADPSGNVNFTFVRP